MKTRTGFKETLALKTSLDRILAPFGGEYGDETEEQLVLPVDRFINPAGTSGHLLKSHRCSTTYAVGDFRFLYTAQWPDRMPRFSFETLTTAEPSALGELHLYGRTLWEYHHTPTGVKAGLSIISSEQALENKVKQRILAVVNDRASQYAMLWSGLISDALRS